MLDLNECDPAKLDDFELCFRILNDLPDQIGMTKITQPHVFRYSGLVPEDKGITGVVIIAESHISIHTFPEKNYAFVDIFSCKPFDIEPAKQYFIKAFESKDPDVFITERGLKFPRR
jgi:S-adenosylmethionine decarboxylase